MSTFCKRTPRKRQRRASLHDFHSFRVAWITLASAAGVPLELVQRVTGHRAVAVVLKHYFRPGREDFRQVLTKAMPTMLGESTHVPVKAEMQDILAQTSCKTWRRDAQGLTELLSRL